MKKAYKEALDGIAVSNQMRERLLAAAARPHPRLTWVKPVCGAAACFALVCVVGLTGLELLGPGLNIGMAKSAAPEAADYATADACAPGTADGGDNGAVSYSYSTADLKTEAAVEEEASTEATAEVNDSMDALPDAEAGGGNPAQTPQTLIGNPLVKYSSLEDAAAVLAFDPVVPEEAMAGDVAVIAGEILQLRWEDGVIEYTYRTAPGGGDVSGIYTDWDVTEAVEIDDCDIAFTAELKGSGETVSLALWERDGMAFSLSAEPGISKDKILSIIQ